MCINISTARTTQRQLLSGNYSTILTVNETSVVAELVGEMCTVNCIVNNKLLKLLPDTGAHVPVINKDKQESNFPDVPIQDIISIFDSCDSLQRWIQSKSCSSNDEVEFLEENRHFL